MSQNFQILVNMEINGLQVDDLFGSFMWKKKTTFLWSG